MQLKKLKIQRLRGGEFPILINFLLFTKINRVGKFCLGIR